MSSSRRARLPRAFTSAVLRLVTLALLVGVFGSITAHHDDTATTDPTGATAAVAAMGPQSDTRVGETTTMMTTSDASWLAAAGCSALAVCCIVGLVVAKRAARQYRGPLLAISRARHTVAPETPAIVAAAARPCLLALSISRT